MRSSHLPFRRRHLFAALASLLLAACGRTSEAPSPRAPDETPSEIAEAPESFDVVIVGGGLAGLSAASELFGRRTLLLEREPRLGGRVHTESVDDTHYELGAIFAYDPGWLPPGATPSPRSSTERRVGYSEAGITRFGDSAQAVVDSLEGRSTDSTRFTKHLPARRAFFGIIHPGAWEDYIYERKNDWRTTYGLHRPDDGNGELVDALARASGAEIRLGATVTGVEEGDDEVRVTYEREGATEAVTARVAILATPAPVAAELLGERAEGHPVSRIRYAPGVVVVLGVEGASLEPFSYVVSEDAGLSGVMSHEDDETRVLTVYYARSHAEAASALDDDQLVRHTVERIGALGVGELDPSEVRFSDVRRWEMLGTVITGEPYESLEEQSWNVSPRVLLAGDYTHWDEGKMPYGMGAAVASGRRAGAEAKTLLRTSRGRGAGETSPITAREATALHARLGLPVPGPSEFSPLTTCEVFELGNEAPRYLGRLNEGAIAPYGVLLLAERDEAIEEHLLESAVDGLWEYSAGYGATSADSALVLEGLLAAGVDEAMIVQSLERIRDRYFDGTTGGFATVERGRAAYWSGPSVDTTAMIAHLMQRVAPERFDEELRAAARYLLAEQEEDGLFRGRWFPSWVLPTSYAVRFLARRSDPSGEYRAAIERATAAIVELQREDGSAIGSVSETAHLVMTLAVTRNHPDALSAAKRWLEGQLDRGISAGEGFLYYWFEDPEGGRTFLTCRDRGQLANAWARAALKDPPAPPAL